MIFLNLLNLSLSLIALIFTITTLKKTSNIIDRLHTENMELRKIKNNAEQRAMIFARKIKAIEDIVIESKKKDEFAVNIVNSIIKELFTDDNQGK